MERISLFDGKQLNKPIAVPTRRSCISMSRFFAIDADSSQVSAPVQDAHLVIFQVLDQPAHDVWTDGSRRDAPFTPAGGLSILDLSLASRAEIPHPFSSIHLHIPRLALEDLADDAGAPRISHLSVGREWAVNDQTFQQLCPILLKAAQAPVAYAKGLMDHLLLAATNHVATAYGGMRTHTARRGELAPWQVRRAKELIEANLTNELSLQQIAEACKLSLAHFSRAFKVSTGVTPHAWLQQRRIERAQGLLRQGDLSLAQIAINAGFADQSHFTRVFKRSAGITPAVWRRVNEIDCDAD